MSYGMIVISLWLWFCSVPGHLENHLVLTLLDSLESWERFKKSEIMSPPAFADIASFNAIRL